MIRGLGLDDPLDPTPPPDAAPEGEDASPLFSAPVTGRRPPRERRSSLLVSLTAHAAIVMLLAPIVIAPLAPRPDAAEEKPRVVARFMMPPSLLPRPRPRAVAPVPRQRISVGPPDSERARELVLRRDEDITKAAKGVTRTNAGPVAPAEAADAHVPAPAPAVERTASLPDLPRSQATAGPGLPLPRGLLQQAVARAEAGTGQGAYGDPAGDTQRMSGLQFDPQGADFTLWMQRFKDEVYRNWVIPQSVMWGWGGEVAFEFVVERDGRMSSVRELSGSGTRALDRAAENALVASRLLALPPDYAPPSVTMRVVFVYGRATVPQAARR